MATDKPLLLSAILENIEVEGDIEKGKREMRSQYSVRLYVTDKRIAKSAKKPASLGLKWEWNADNLIWFEPSSMMKAVLYRGFKTDLKRLNHLVGQHEGKVVDLLANNASFDLTDEKGNPIPIKMQIALSPTSKSDDYIKEFMETIAADVSRLPSNDGMASTVSTLGQVLKFTKTIMDQLSQAHPLLNASWTFVSGLYQAVQETDIQDDSIRELANTLSEMLGTANGIHDLPEIPNTTDVIEEISRQTLHVASLIHEYTKLSRAVRTVKIQGDLKSHIEKCQYSCTALMVKLSRRINVDTHTRVKKIEDGQLADKIHKWLSPPDSSRNRNEAHGKREGDTCSWLLDGERFLRWLKNPGFLWVKGNSGCGKSVLCSSIIDVLPPSTPSHGIAYFFFDGRDGQTELQLHNKLIRSLISQLSDIRHGGIPECLVDLHKNCGAQQPLDDQLQNVLNDILDGFPHAYIVIDALDECIDRETTLNWINKLVADRKAQNLHIVVTSRPEPDIKEVFRALDPHSIDVGEATANHDIMKYITLQMKLKSKFTKYDENTRMKIELQLAKSAEGSF